MTVKELKKLIKTWDDCDTLYVTDKEGRCFYLGFPEFKDGNWSHCFNLQ